MRGATLRPPAGWSPVHESPAPPPGAPEPQGARGEGFRAPPVASWLPWAVGLAVLVTCLGLLNTLPVGAMFDDAQYVILARSLASGAGLSWINLPGAPAATHFPPGYPAVLALLWRAWPEFPANLMLFKAANALFIALAAVAMARFASNRLQLPPLAAAALALAGMLGIPSLVLATVVMSEPLFLALALASLLWAERLADRASAVASPWQPLALGLALGAATLVRSHGIALVGAVLLVLATRRRWRDATLVGGAAGTALLPWFLFVAANGGVVPDALRGNYESYTAWLVAGVREEGIGLLVHAAAQNVLALAGMLRVVFAPSVSGALAVLALVLIAGLCGIGAWQLWRRAPVTTLFLGLYLLIVLVWPFAPTRFFWGVWPLLLLLPVLAVRWAWAFVPATASARALRYVVVGAGVLLCAGHAVYTWRGVRGRWWESIPSSAAAAAAPTVAWVRANTAQGDVVASTVENVVYLYGGRHAVPPAAFRARDYRRAVTPAEAAADLHDIADAYGVRAVVLTPGTPSAVIAGARLLATQRPPRLAPLDSTAHLYILGPATAAPRPTADQP